MPHNCRFCSTPLETVFADLGSTPWSNSFLEPTEEALARERSFPLKAMVCSECLLVQTTETVPADEIFTDGYAYLVVLDKLAGTRPPLRRYHDRALRA